MRLRVTALLLLLALGIVALAGSVTHAAFTSSLTRDGNAIASGTVALSDNDGGGVLVSLAAALPGASDTGCIKVTYGGSLPSAVRLHGATGGTGLDPYLSVVVTRGAYSPSEPAFRSCATFVADATDYIGAGPGVVYSGTLAGFPDDHATGVVDPAAGSPETWTTGESHVYRVAVTVLPNEAGQGRTAAQTFTWEARNL